MTRLFFLVILLASMGIACSTSGKEDMRSESLAKQSVPLEDTIKRENLSLRDTVFYLYRNKDSIRVKLLVPAERKGTILFLHGWNLPPDEICQKTNACQQLLDSGYVLILPDFGKTTYQWENYPQTRKSYLKYPTRHWIQDTFLRVMSEQFHLLEKKENNFVMGVSTGGRGAALLALENPEIFKASACLSADFDHSKLSDEPINNGFYGPMSKFSQRWTGKDNIFNRASEFKSGLFLAHGEKDKVCPAEQTRDFQAELKRLKVKIQLETVLDPQGDHTYVWWDQQILPVIQFFNRF